MYIEDNMSYLSLSIERSFKEVKRRTRVVGRFPNETSALVMVFSLLNERGWIRQKFLHLANGKKNIGKRIEGKQGLSGVIRFKGYGK